MRRAPPGRAPFALLWAPTLRPRRANDTTSQGHPLAILRRPIDVGNVVAAEIAAHELRGLSLADALGLTALMALRNRDRSRRMAARWVQRWLDETIDDVVMVAGCLAFGGTAHEPAVLPFGLGPGSSNCR